MPHRLIIGAGKLGLKDSFTDQRDEHARDTSKHETSSTEFVDEKCCKDIAREGDRHPYSEKQQWHGASKAEIGEYDDCIVCDQEGARKHIAEHHDACNHASFAVGGSLEDFESRNARLLFMVVLDLALELVELLLDLFVRFFAFAGMKALEDGVSFVVSRLLHEPPR